MESTKHFVATSHKYPFGLGNSPYRPGSARTHLTPGVLTGPASSREAPLLHVGYMLETFPRIFVCPAGAARFRWGKPGSSNDVSSLCRLSCKQSGKRRNIRYLQPTMRRMGTDPRFPGGLTPLNTCRY